MVRVYRIDGAARLPHDLAIRDVAHTLLAGGLALVPTETVYGLGVAVDAAARSAVAPAKTDAPAAALGCALPPPASGYRRIFDLKQRDLAQTVPWLVGGIEDIDRYGRAINDVTRALAQAFWPGALTLIVDANERVPRFMQASDGTVALRASASPVIQALVRACSCPLATTSANTHGAPAPASFSAAEPRILAGVDVAIDAQETPCQDASTIVSARGGSVEIVRHGAIADEEIYRVAQGAAGHSHGEG